MRHGKDKPKCYLQWCKLTWHGSNMGIAQIYKTTKDKKETITAKYNFLQHVIWKLVKNGPENTTINGAIKEKFLLSTFSIHWHCQYRFLLSTQSDNKTGCQHVWTHVNLFSNEAFPDLNYGHDGQMAIGGNFHMPKV